VIHSKFLPYEEATFEVLSKIIQDTEVPQQIVNKILADQVVARRLFSNSQVADKILTGRLD
jgi:hypothetical protein